MIYSFRQHKPLLFQPHSAAEVQSTQHTQGAIQPRCNTPKVQSTPCDQCAVILERLARFQCHLAHT